jgi:hypothetical protein
MYRSPSLLDVAVDLSNASPGGAPPWQLRRGQCGLDEGTFGPADAFKSLTADDRSRASAANARTPVACVSLAAPSR